VPGARPITCLLLIVALGGAASGCAALPGPAVRQIREADDAYNAQRYAEADKILSPVIDDYLASPDIAEALYLRGLCRLRTARPVEAQADLEAALERSQRPDLTDRLHTQLGNLEYNQERYNRAVGYYEDSYRDLPNRPPKDRVGLQYGVALQRLGRFGEARGVFNDVATRFANTDFGAEARRKAGWTHDYFTIQCGVYREIGGAHRLAQTLKDKGIDALAVPEDGASSKLYMVRVGRYRTYTAARQALPAVQRVQRDAFIAP
jgi:tetratricopeptide (TPR) repeat protein